MLVTIVSAIRKGLAFELLNAQGAVLCSYPKFAQRSGQRNERQIRGENGKDVFQGLGNFVEASKIQFFGGVGKKNTIRS